MAAIFHATFERTLDRLIDAAVPGTAFEAWTFDDRASRRAAERRLAEKGVTARVRSAYKPLLCAFLEEIDLDGVEAIEIAHPVHPAAPANRFRLEAYPLTALVGDRRIDFVARADGDFFHDVRLLRHGRTESTRVWAPNRVHVDIVGETDLSPTGWLRRAGETIGERLETDYERLFDAAMRALADHDWGGTEPFFEELNIAVRYPAEDERLDVGDEHVSLREALHEEFYFSTLELFQKKSGRPSGDRGLRPGQIVPQIRRGQGEVSVRIETRDLATDDPPGRETPLDTAGEPPDPARIARLLDDIGGAAFQAMTRAGRIVAARHVVGDDAPVMISGGQHANEPTGIVGALRAATRLARRPGAHFVVAPLENPDGYALGRRLCADDPRHMHHAARYTAFGDDLDHRSRDTDPIGETAIRFQALDHARPELHVNLHGYPSHEWTRPLTGYVPRNFAMWTLPKGFFLVVRHHEGRAAQAEFLLERVTRHLAALPGLVAENRRQIALYERHAGDTGFRMINGFACSSTVDHRHPIPVTIITEYPDETIRGADFVAGHTAQMEAALAAYDAWQELRAETPVA